MLLLSFDGPAVEVHVRGDLRGTVHLHPSYTLFRWGKGNRNNGLQGGERTENGGYTASKASNRQTPLFSWPSARRYVGSGHLFPLHRTPLPPPPTMGGSSVPVLSKLCQGGYMRRGFLSWFRGEKAHISAGLSRWWKAGKGGLLLRGVTAPELKPARQGDREGIQIHLFRKGAECPFQFSMVCSANNTYRNSKASFSHWLSLNSLLV